MMLGLRLALVGAGLATVGFPEHAWAAGGQPVLAAQSHVGPFARGAQPDEMALQGSNSQLSIANLAEDEDADDDATADAPEVAGSRDYRWTAADVLFMRDRASSRARCIVDREVGGFGYDPWRRGTQGERGPVQLHPRGLLPEYLVWSGGQAPENPYYAIPFLEYKLRQGQGRHWSPVRLGLC